MCWFFKITQIHTYMIILPPNAKDLQNWPTRGGWIKKKTSFILWKSDFVWHMRKFYNHQHLYMSASSLHSFLPLSSIVTVKTFVNSNHSWILWEMVIEFEAISRLGGLRRNLAFSIFSEKWIWNLLTMFPGEIVIGFYRVLWFHLLAMVFFKILNYIK